jgi:hypothetical protein
MLPAEQASIWFPDIYSNLIFLTTKYRVFCEIYIPLASTWNDKRKPDNITFAVHRQHKAFQQNRSYNIS